MANDEIGVKNQVNDAIDQTKAVSVFIGLESWVDQRNPALKSWEAKHLEMISGQAASRR
jgi:hypothetical protein